MAYVLQAMERSLPGIREHRIAHAIAGVRPDPLRFWQLRGRAVPRLRRVRSRRTRRCAGILDPRRWQAGGLSPDGGRRDRPALCAALGIDESCRTHETPLPGAERREVDPAEVSRRFGVGVAGSGSGRLSARRPCERSVLGGQRPRRRAPCVSVSPSSTRSCGTLARAEGLRTLEDACVSACASASAPARGLACGGSRGGDARLRARLARGSGRCRSWPDFVDAALATRSLPVLGG